MKKLMTLAVALFAVFTLSACGEDPVEGDTYLEFNPYEGVDWENVDHMLSNLHTHTDHSTDDGEGAAHTVIDNYQQAGYGALALTDHDYMITGRTPTFDTTPYPWTELSSIHDHWEDRDPDDLGMIAIDGVEFSDAHHFVGLWTGFLPDYNPDGNADLEYLNRLIDDSLDDNSDALFFMAHPGRYTDDDYPVPDEGDFSLEWYQSLYDDYEEMIGIEIINTNDRHPYDRHLWDQLLETYMPERPLWAFANDDYHGDSMEELGWSKNVALMEDTSDEAEFRQNLIDGRFYAQYTRTERTYAPMIEEIIVDETDRTIEIVVEGDYDRIKWYGGYDYDDGLPNLIQTGETFQYNDYEGNYIRVEVVYNEGGFEHAETVLQPFGFVQDPDR